jgi:hypothetical protein
VLSPGTHWTVTEIRLECRYMADKLEAVVIPCQSLSVMPAKYVTDIATDGHQQRSEIVEASLLAEGVDLSPLKGVRWTPTHLVFMDATTGEAKELAVSSYGIEGSHVVRIFLPNGSVGKEKAPGRSPKLRKLGKTYGNVEAGGRHLYFTILEEALGFQITVVKTPGTSKASLGSHLTLEKAKEESDAYARNHLASGGLKVPPITWY